MHAPEHDTVAVPARKYNPGFLTDHDLVASFCVRTTEFELLIEVLRECTGSSNPHQIVIGPRGSGKTSLLLRVAAEVRRDAALAARCFPVMFAEESYEVATAGEFWLECLTHLAAQAPRAEGGPDLRRTAGELRVVRDDRVLADRCLAALLDFADRHDKRLLLLVENLNALFRDMADRDAGWRLRKILQTEPRIILFASATSRFEEIDHPDRALYELFRVRTLRPLDTGQCAALWESVAGRRPARETVRSLEILTGGSPRLIAIVARFGAGMSFRELMADLLDLVDDHTEYFKSHIESLPAQERRVYLALATLWKPATTREIADQARLDTSTCSAQLARLGERGVVHVAGGSARRKQYYLTERLYNIYYLLRRRRGPDPLVEALIRFMESYYSPAELMDIGMGIAREVGSVAAEMQPVYWAAFGQLAGLPALAAYRKEFLAVMSPVAVEPGEGTAARALVSKGFWFHKLNRLGDALAVWDEVVRRYGTSEEPSYLELVANVFLYRGIAFAESNRPEDALATWDEVVRRYGVRDEPLVFEAVALALLRSGLVLEELNRPAEALAAWDEVVRRYGTSDAPAVATLVAQALANKGVRLRKSNRMAEALAAWNELVRRYEMHAAPAVRRVVAEGMFRKGLAFVALKQPDAAIATYDEIVRRFGTSASSATLEVVAQALANKGILLGELQQPRDALAVWEEVEHRFGVGAPRNFHELLANALANKGAILAGLDLPEEALAAWDETVRRFSDSETSAVQAEVARALANKGALLVQLSRVEGALAACDEVLRRFGASEAPSLLEQVARVQVYRGVVLGVLRRLDEAVAAYDDALRRFGMSREPALATAVALVNKALTLETMRRPEDAVATYGEAVRRLEESEAPALRSLLDRALLGKANMELECRRFDAAVETAGRLLERCCPDSPENRLAGHLIRSQAALAQGDRSACERDVESILVLLPALDSLPKDVMDVLMRFSIELGSERMHELIEASPSAALLLPLVTVLRADLGLKPRVAQEVEAVAADIRTALAKLKEGGHTAPDARGVAGSTRLVSNDC